MKRSTKWFLGALVIYAGLVALNERLIQETPKIARFFAPPAFQFSHDIRSGSASPFKVGMHESQISNAARRANLMPYRCWPKKRIIDLDYGPSRCFEYEATGVFWDIWTADDRIVAVHIYTTMNITSE